MRAFYLTISFLIIGGFAIVALLPNERNSPTSGEGGRRSLVSAFVQQFSSITGEVASGTLRSQADPNTNQPQPITGNSTALADALGAVKTSFISGLERLEADIDTYAQLATVRAGRETLQDHHRQTRLSFKAVEWLLEYIDPTAIKRNINGAPLPKTEPKVPAIVIIEPKGLQTLDELVFADSLDYAEIQKLAKKLKKQFGPVKVYAQNRRLQHRHVFEALRLEVIRMFTLGITGFDTPGSGAAIEEALATSLAIQNNYLNYAPLIRAVAPHLDQAMLKALNQGIESLQEADFDTFDRLRFLRETVNPFTECIVAAQEELQIEFAGERMNPINPRAKKLFDADWFNADLYARSPRSDYEEKRIELGRLLFFDPILSANNQRACASCHLPEKAFTDGQQRSLALDGAGTILRNSPTLINSVYAEKFFYDLREERLDRQIKHVVHDSLEFATDFIEITEKIEQSEEYRQLFHAAYPDYPEYAISRYSISDALARYIKQLRAHNSPFDQMARGDIDVDPKVASGFNLFAGKGACATCHFAPTFSGLVPPYFRESESEVLGVPATKTWEQARIDPDLGRIANYKPQDNAYFHAFAFKTPTIRNVALTAPYMHNGVYEELSEVMKFYNLGGGAGIGSSVEHQTLAPDPLNLSEAELDNLIVFMQALTDTTGLTRRPRELPTFTGREDWNQRTIGGTY